MRGRMKRLLVLLLLVCLCVRPIAQAETLLSFKREQSGESYVEYPQLDGMANAFIQDTVNQAIFASLGGHLNTLTVLSSGVPGQLTVNSEAAILPSSDGHDVLALLVRAKGRMPNGRNGYSNLPMQFDLANGQALGADAVFADKKTALDWITEDLYGRFQDELSNYLDLSGLEPFPVERMLLSDSGVTFFYPDKGMAWLSGKPATIRYLYHELKNVLNLEPGSVLFNLGVMDRLAPNSGTAEQIFALAGQGKLPGLPVQLGDSLDDAIESFGLLYDAEGFPGGEKYQLEDDAFRGTAVISLDADTIHGLLSTRMNLGGLITGQTDRDTALAALGQPLVSLPLTADAAAVYGLPEGRLDSYRYDGNELKLYYGAENMLYAVWLQKTV